MKNLKSFDNFLNESENFYDVNKFISNKYKEFEQVLDFKKKNLKKQIDQAKKLVEEFCKKHDLTIISEEIYENKSYKNTQYFYDFTLKEGYREIFNKTNVRRGARIDYKDLYLSVKDSSKGGVLRQEIYILI